MLKFFQDKLYLANAGAGYNGKVDLFYPLKSRLLQKYGRYKGWQKQTITHECWTCSGGSYYLGYECDRCGGTGIYSRNTHFLKVWQLGDRLYHTPVNEQLPEAEFIGEVSGKIKHEYIESKVGQNALIWLLARYRPLLPVRLYLQMAGLRLYQKYWQCWWSRTMHVSGWRRWIAIVAAAFAGYHPSGIFDDRIRFGSKHDTYEHYLHLCWVLNAWNITDPDASDIPF